MTLKAGVLGPLEALVSATRANAQIRRIDDRRAPWNRASWPTSWPSRETPAPVGGVRAEPDLDRDRERLRPQPHRRKSVSCRRTGGCNSPKSFFSTAGGARPVRV